MKTIEPTRAVLNLSMEIPEGETARDVQDRIQKFFNFYHPRYHCVVTVDPSSPSQPPEEVSDEESALLGDEPAGLDLLG